MRGLGPFLKDAWRLTRPYFMTSEEKWSARGMLVGIIAMNLTLVGLSVILSYWRREFYNALQDKDWKAFLELLFLYRNTSIGFMPGFCEVAAVDIVLAVYSIYVNQLLQIRWRRWMTSKFLNEWLADRAYYHISLTVDRAGALPQHAVQPGDQREAILDEAFLDGGLDAVAVAEGADRIGRRQPGQQAIERIGSHAQPWRSSCRAPWRWPVS